jgi:lipid A ethanolaminephosphotransferase
MLKKPVNPHWLLLGYALALASLYNLPLWQKVFPLLPDNGRLAITIAILASLTGFFFLALNLVPTRLIGRSLLSLILLTSALASYFMQQYGIVIDANMIQNVLQTDWRETLELITPKMLAYVTALGVLPIWLLWKIPVKQQPFHIAIKQRGVALLTTTIFVGATTIAFYPNLAPLVRNNTDLKYSLLPNNIINGLKHHLGKSLATPIKISAIGTDAHKTTMTSHLDKPTLFVLVVGETARADHFSLGGYTRNTNPELSREQNVIYFDRVHSCGTETAVSLPCMFSGMGRDNYSHNQAASQENLLDIVKRAGTDVIWMDNQSGCKNICARVKNLQRQSLQKAANCGDEECHDDIFINEVRKLSHTLQHDTLLVLHQMGSHGPAYHLRYPSDFDRFHPACKTAQIDQCSVEQIRNSYDNTILFTDHVLAGIISALKEPESAPAAMLYLSDHGESLGEMNMYLHGAPYFIAPEQQKHIPMIFWMSDFFESRKGIENGCLAREKNTPLSHDNLFHSVLGILDIGTSLYQPRLDMFNHCRAKAKPASGNNITRGHA